MTDFPLRRIERRRPCDICGVPLDVGMWAAEVEIDNGPTRIACTATCARIAHRQDCGAQISYAFRRQGCRHDIHFFTAPKLHTQAAALAWADHLWPELAGTFTLAREVDAEIALESAGLSWSQTDRLRGDGVVVISVSQSARRNIGPAGVRRA